MVSLRRRILFLVFLAIFFISTPLIILYSAGYKINLKHPFSLNMIQKTGIIIFGTEPSGANIYINEKKQEMFSSKFILNRLPIKTPAKIKNMLPGEYDARIELAGYWPWNKKINIESGRISYAEDIKLFKKELPVKVDNASNQIFFQSHDKKKIFLPKENTILSLKNEDVIELKEKTTGDVLWSNDDKKIIIGAKIFDLKHPEKIIDLEKIIGKDLEKIKWDNNSNKIYYLHKNSLNNFNLETNISSSLFEGENILDFLISDEKIFFISQKTKEIKLKIYSTKDKKISKEISMPMSDNYRFVNEDSHLINLYDIKYKTLYLLNPLAIDPREEIINNVKYSFWSEDKKLFYTNDFEIWVLDIENNKKELITRISDQITGIIKMKKDDSKKENSHIIYSTQKSINILERDKDNKIQIIELLKLDSVSDPVLNEEEDILYFNGKIGNQEGFYKIKI